jgi:hypothetical protein
LLHGGDEHDVLQDKGSIDKYLGVNIKQIDANTFKLAQTFLIDTITTFLGIKMIKQTRSSQKASFEQGSLGSSKKV